MADLDPGNAYRRLLPSEVLCDGDEFWCRNGSWYKTGDQGELVGNEFPYRRLRDETNAGLDREDESR